MLRSTKYFDNDESWATMKKECVGLVDEKENSVPRSLQGGRVGLWVLLKRRRDGKGSRQTRVAGFGSDCPAIMMLVRDEGRERAPGFEGESMLTI